LEAASHFAATAERDSMPSRPSIVGGVILLPQPDATKNDSEESTTPIPEARRLSMAAEGSADFRHVISVAIACAVTGERCPP
jgi:hypothetical protein